MNISKYLRSISPELKSWINSLAMKSKEPTVEARRIVTQGGEKLKKIDMFSPSLLNSLIKEIFMMLQGQHKVVVGMLWEL